MFDGARTSPSASFELPVKPKTKTLYSYQLAAVETILQKRRVLAGLQPGMGKTAILQAVAAARALEGERTLVIVPPALRPMWLNEFHADYPQLDVQTATGMKPQALPDADVVVMNDSLLAGRIDDILDWKPGAILVDEAHRMKNVESRRTKAMFQLAAEHDSDQTLNGKDAVIIAMATGTLATNHAGDVYAPLRVTGKQNAADVSGDAKWSRFLDEWCETKIAWKRRVVVGCKDIEGLRQQLLETCMLNVPRDEVLDLPERTFSQVDLLLSDADLAEYKYVQKQFLQWVTEQYGEDAALRASKAEAITRMMRLWEYDGKAKVRTTVEYVRNLTDQDEQVVVMAWHASVMREIADRLEAQGLRVMCVNGGVDADRKAEAVQLFQDGKVDVLVGQIAAAGVGLTLTAACHIVFAQLPWSPAVFAQATDRIYRIGQERHTFVHVLNMEDGISQRLWAVLNFKAQTVDGINNGQPTTIDPGSIVSSVLAGFGWEDPE